MLDEEAAGAVLVDDIVLATGVLRWVTAEVTMIGARTVMVMLLLLEATPVNI